MKNETKRNVTQGEKKDNRCRFCREIPEDCECSREEPSEFDKHLFAIEPIATINGETV